MKESLDSLFSAGTLAGYPIPNRLTAQAMEINASDENGAVSPDIISRYENLARGGWGIVFVEAISVAPDSLARKRGLVLTEKNLDSFKKLVDSFKKIDDRALFILQLTHAGRYSGDFSRPVKAIDDENSAVLLSDDELKKIRDDFIHCLSLASKAGADGVDIKACHGYLGGELLRPSNTRKGDWGGSPENRARLLTNVLSAARTLHPRMVRGSRISFYEAIRGGCGTAGADEIIEDMDDMLGILELIVDAGAQYLNISAGIPTLTPQLTRPGKSSFINVLQHFRYCREIKKRFAGLPVIGSAYSAAGSQALTLADENISRGYVDFAGFGRQNLADPLYPLHIRNDENRLRECTLCGGCSMLLKKQGKVYCRYYEKE